VIDLSLSLPLFCLHAPSKLVFAAVASFHLRGYPSTSKDQPHPSSSIDVKSLLYRQRATITEVATSKLGASDDPSRKLTRDRDSRVTARRFDHVDRKSMTPRFDCIRYSRRRFLRSSDGEGCIRAMSRAPIESLIDTPRGTDNGCDTLIIVFNRVTRVENLRHGRT